MKNLLFILSFLLTVISAYSQAKVKSGSIDFLKGPEQKLIKLEFNYDLFLVKGMKEEEFLKKYIEVKNTQKPGTGEGWAEKWIENKPGWEEQFESYLNASVPTKNIVTKKNIDNAKYIMTVCPVDLEPGFFAGFTQNPGYLSATIYIKEFNNPGKILVELFVSKAHIKKAYFVSNNEYLRVKDNYGMAGEYLGKFFAKKCK